MTHPTSIYFHNSAAMRLVYQLDRAEIDIWWSPLAGESYACEDRWYSSRDAHFSHFARISLPGCDRAAFASCEWDPFHSVLRFYHQRLHIRMLPDEPLVHIEAESVQEIELESERFDQLTEADASGFYLLRREPRHTFLIGAELGSGDGAFRHARMGVPNHPHYTQAMLSPGQGVTLGCALEGRGDLRKEMRRIVGLGKRDLDLEVEAPLGAALGKGTVETVDASLDAFHALTKRSLYAACDKSGAVRASLKGIYYLIWLRDGSFCYRYLSSAGWTHRLREWCRFVLENRTVVDLPGKGPAPVFTQMVHKQLGKLEEDGIYYALLSHFFRVVQLPGGAIAETEIRDLVESYELIHDYMFEPDRGLYGSWFADETPCREGRDYGWDYAMGRPGPTEMLVHHDKPVRRAFDLYMNLMMLETLQMLTVLDEGQREKWHERASKLWEAIEPFFGELTEGLPTYGELLYENGEREWSKPFEPCISMYPFSLGLPLFAPIPQKDSIRASLFEYMMRSPSGHWTNALGCVMASLDTLVYPEEKIIEGLRLIERQSMQSGFYHPMPGAMPEKIDAPQGVIYHDIRPQAFAQACWMGALSNLAVRRMPFGLAVRPSAFMRSLHAFEWKDALLDIATGPVEGLPVLQMDGERVGHTLQIPNDLLGAGDHEVRVEGNGALPVLARTTMQLDSVEVAAEAVCYLGQSFGFTEAAFLEAVTLDTITAEDGSAVPYKRTTDGPLVVIEFNHVGPVLIKCDKESKRAQP